MPNLLRRIFVTLEVRSRALRATALSWYLLSPFALLVRRHAVGFVLGAIVVTAFGVQAARPLILGAVPMKSCTPISNVALSTTHEVVLAADADRKSWCISNNDAAIAIYVAYHTTATSADLRLSPGATICDNVENNYIYTGVVDMLAASGTPAIGGFSCK